MTAENVLFALNDIDDEFLEESHADNPSHRRRLIILIAAVIALLAVTACAAEEITGWLSSYFSSRSESDLSAGQIGYIEENEQLVSDAQKHNGYTVELKSYLATDDTVYVVFGITAPKNVDIAGLGKRILLDDEFTGIYGRRPESVTVRHIDDGDGRSNTINYVCILEHKYYVYHTVTEWNVHVNAIQAVEYDALTQRTEFPVLAEGDWNFTIDLTKADTQTVELVSEPLQTLAIIPSTTIDDYSETIDYVTVTSVLLSPLDVIITYEPPNECNASFTGTLAYTGIELHAYAVMKDGSFIPFLYGIPSYHGEAKLLAESPIVLSEVDYVLLADGTKLMVP